MAPEEKVAEERVIEMSELLSKVVYFALDEAKQKLEQAHEFVPFTVLADAENLFIETHPGETDVECFSSAYKTISGAAEAINAYIICYDGFLDTDDGERDAIVIESAEKDAEIGHAFGATYTLAGDELTVDEPLLYLDMVPSFFIDTLEDRMVDSCGCGCGCEDESHEHIDVHEVAEAAAAENAEEAAE